MRYAVVFRTGNGADADRAKVEERLAQLAKFALSRRGTPYVWGANGPKSYDCSGFMRAVYGHIGIHIPRVSFDQGKAGAPIKKNLKHLRTGDLIYFKQDKKSGWPHHVGMYLWNGWFIHCTSSRGVVVESFYESQLKDAVKTVTRLLFTEEEGLWLIQASKKGLVASGGSRYDPETGKVR